VRQKGILKLSHAERNAYEQYIKKYAMPPTLNSIMVVTLSPCIKPLAFSHKGSCLQLLLENKINRVHIGALDTCHVSSIDEYQHAGLLTSITNNDHLSRICQRIYKIIASNGDISVNELQKIKKQLGDNVFDTHERKQELAASLMGTR
jgi:pyrimidine deaminase RibD-like protein